MFDITVQWHHDILRSWQLSHFKKKAFETVFLAEILKKHEIDHECHFINGWTNLFCFPKDEYCVSYSELIQRELLWLEICFFFQFCFPKIVKLFLRNPNPNLTLTPTYPESFSEKKNCVAPTLEISVLLVVS